MHKATRMFINARILTLDGNNTIASAMALDGNRILALGDKISLQDYVGEKTEIVDVDGKTVMPGFYDAHGHFCIYAEAFFHNIDLNSPPIGTCADFETMYARLREAAARTPEGEWIQAYGFDDTMIAEKRFPTRHELDAVSTRHPIFIKHISHHLGALNTLALQRAGITQDTPDPEGGLIRREPGCSEPSGVIEEMELMGQVMELVPPLSDEQRIEAFERLSLFYASRGTTTALDAAIFHERDVELVSKAQRDGRLYVNFVYYPYNPEHIFPDDTARLKQGGIKLLQDGSIQGFTACLSLPYHTPHNGNVGYRGYPTHKREDLVALITQYHRQGCQCVIHTNGDGATDDVIAAVEAAQKAHPREDTRHLLIHAQTIREDQLDSIARLGILPSFFTSHIYFWGDRHAAIFLGPERTNRLNPMRSALDRGIICTAHQDMPVTPLAPFRSIAACVNRASSSGRVYGVEQRISVLEALYAHTINAAFQNFEENSKGSLEPGKLADFIVLDTDPLACAPDRLADIRVLMTVLGGRTVFTA